MARCPTDIRLFSCDLDGTLLGNRESAARFFRYWNALEVESRPILVYNTGRTIADTRLLIERGDLPKAEYIIGGVGTELCDGHFGVDPSFARRFGDGWDTRVIDDVLSTFPDITRQPPEFLHPYKSSWVWRNAPPRDLDVLKNCLVEAGLVVTVVYSSDCYLDIMPARADKGQALQWLCERLGIALADVLVAGDTGNDSRMFQLPWVRRILVSNALPELQADTVGLPKFLASRPMADGVLQGLEHFGVALIGRPQSQDAARPAPIRRSPR